MHADQLHSKDIAKNSVEEINTIGTSFTYNHSRSVHVIKLCEIIAKNCLLRESYIELSPIYEIYLPTPCQLLLVCSIPKDLHYHFIEKSS